MKRWNSFIAVVFFSLCPISLTFLTVDAAFAQAGRGGISGTVTDPSGAVVPKAKITLLSKSTGITQQGCYKHGWSLFLCIAQSWQLRHHGHHQGLRVVGGK